MSDSDSTSAHFKIQPQTLTNNKWNNQFTQINAPLINEGTQQQIPWPANHKKESRKHTHTHTHIPMDIGKENQNNSKNNIECKDKIEIETESDNDCIITKIVSANPTPNSQTTKTKKKISQKPKGNQGSDAEYRRLIQKLGQSMSYAINEEVSFFVPRLAQKGRFNHRIGIIYAQIRNTLRKEHSKYEIIDKSNNKHEIVPWKWILKAPNANNGKDRVPMNSFSTREEKEKEFNRRMNGKESLPNLSAHNGHKHFDDSHIAYKHTNYRKQKQIRSVSVFPQRHTRTRTRTTHTTHTSLTPKITQKHKPKKTRNITVPPLQKEMNHKTVIDIAQSNSDGDIEIKPEIIEQITKPTQHSSFNHYSHSNINRDRNDRNDRGNNNNKYFERPRSRSRSPSQIRPSNRIGNNNRNYYTQSPPHTYEPYYDRYYNKYRYYDRYYRPPTQQTQSMQKQNRATPPPPTMAVPMPMPMPMPIPMPMKRSRSRDRDREHWRDRDLRERDYYYYERERDMRERDRYYRERGRHYQRDRDHRGSNITAMNRGNESVAHSLLMQTWLQVTNRMRGGSKLGEREINYLCENDVRPEVIKCLMDSDKPIQEKYDLVAHCVDPTNGQNLTRSQVYSIIGAVITMNF